MATAKVGFITLVIVHTMMFVELERNMDEYDKFYLVGIFSICGSKYNESETTRNAHAYRDILSRIINFLRIDDNFSFGEEIEYISFDVCNDSKSLTNLVVDLSVNQRYYDLQRCINGVADRDCWKVLAITTYLPSQLRKLVQTLMSDVEGVFLHNQDGIQMGMSPYKELFRYEKRFIQYLTTKFKDVWREIRIINVEPESAYERDLKEPFYHPLIEDLVRKLQQQKNCIKVLHTMTKNRHDQQRVVNLFKNTGGKNQSIFLICSPKDCNRFLEVHKILLDKAGINIAFFADDESLNSTVFDEFEQAGLFFFRYQFLTYMTFFMDILDNRNSYENYVTETIIKLKESSIDIFYIGSSLVLLDYLNWFVEANTSIIENPILYLTHLKSWQEDHMRSTTSLSVSALTDDTFFTTTTCEILCPPGFYVTFGQLENHTTKWDIEYGEVCIPCSNNSVKQNIGRQPCTVCSGILQPNRERTDCIDPFKDIYFHFNDLFSIFCTTFSMICFVLALYMFLFFFLKRESPMVKIFDRNLTFAHLVTCMLIYTFVPFVYLGQPSNLKCILRICVLAIFYDLNISIVLVKSNKLVNAFVSRNRVSTNQVLQVNLTQAFLVIMNIIIACSILITYFQNKFYGVRFSSDVKVYSCNYGYENLLIGFSIAIHLSCSFQAYRCRKLPRYMSDAWSILYISFINSVTFIIYFPVSYFQENDLERSAVVLVALLLNTSIILLLMYSKKLFVMVFHPEKNSPKYFREQQMNKMRRKANLQVAVIGENSTH